MSMARVWVEVDQVVRVDHLFEFDLSSEEGKQGLRELVALYKTDPADVASHLMELTNGKALEVLTEDAEMTLQHPTDEEYEAAKAVVGEDDMACFVVAPDNDNSIEARLARMIAEAV